MNINAKIFAAICREPFRFFFPLGIVAGTIGIGQWLLYALGLVSSYSGFFHSSIQTMVYVNCFIVGFLMTALPRFTQTPCARWWELLTPLSLFVGIVIFLALNEWVVAECALLGWYAFLMYFALSRVMNRAHAAPAGKPPVELVWVPIAFLHGIIGTMILMFGQAKVWPVWALKVGKPMMDQGFLVCLVMGIAGFLIPRLMGTYEQRPSCAQDHGTICDASCMRQKDQALGKACYYLACAVLFFVSFFVEGFGWPAVGYGLRAAAVTAAFLKSNVLGKAPVDGGLYVWVAWVSAWMVAAGFWGASLLNIYQTMMLHITFIGGFSLMTFAIASMVVMSHAGEGQRLNAGVWVVPAVAAGVLLTLVTRLMAAVFPDYYFQILGWAAGIWIAAAWIWLIFMLPRLARFPAEDEFGRMHDEAAKAQFKGNIA